MSARSELAELRRLDELEARVSRRPAPKEEAPNPTEGNSFLENAREGYGGATTMLGRQLGNLLFANDSDAVDERGGRLVQTRKTRPESFISKESIAEQRNLDKPLMDTGGGKVGAFTAGMVNTAPLAVAGKAAQVMGGAARGAPGLLAKAGSALASAPGRAAVEGALSGGIASDPGERLEGAVGGGAGGGLISAGGRALKRTLQGIVKPSADAEMLRTVAAQHGIDPEMTISQAADDKGLSGMVKHFYNTLLPLVPGAPNALKRGEENAAGKFRELALREASPEGTALPDAAGTHVHDSMAAIGDAFQKEYKDTIKQYAFNAPKAGEFETRLKAKFPNIDDTSLAEVSDAADAIVSRYAKGGVLDGDNLIRAKTDLANLGRAAKGSRTGQGFAESQGLLDDLVRTELRQGGNPQNIADLERYESLEQPWKNFMRVQNAAAKSDSPQGEFTAKELKKSIQKLSSDRELARGEAPLQDVADIGVKTLGQKSRYPGFIEKSLAWGGLGAGSILLSPAGLTVPVAARALAGQTAQKGLMGQLDSQKAIIEYLRKHPSELLRSGVRGGITRQFGAEDNATEQ